MFNEKYDRVFNIGDGFTGFLIRVCEIIGKLEGTEYLRAENCLWLARGYAAQELWKPALEWIERAYNFLETNNPNTLPLVCRIRRLHAEILYRTPDCDEKAAAQIDSAISALEQLTETEDCTPSSEDMAELALAYLGRGDYYGTAEEKAEYLKKAEEIFEAIECGEYDEHDEDYYYEGDGQYDGYI